MSKALRLPEHRRPQDVTPTAYTIDVNSHKGNDTPKRSSPARNVADLSSPSSSIALEVESERRHLAERLARLGKGLPDATTPPQSVRSIEVRDQKQYPPETYSTPPPPTRQYSASVEEYAVQRNWGASKKRRSHSTPPSLRTDEESSSFLQKEHYVRGFGSPSRQHLTTSLSQTDLFALNETGAEECKARYEVGAQVKARWRCGPIYYRGKIAAISRDGTRFTVAFDDGSVECDVLEANVRPIPADARSRSRAEIRVEIFDFYRRHNPSKLAQIDNLLDRCGPGNEEALLEAIQRKYAGQIPAGSAANRRESTATVASVPATFVCAADAATSAARLAALAAGRAAARAEIYAIYAAKRPAKVRDVDKLVERAGGSERELLAAIKCKYFPPYKTRVVADFSCRAHVVREIVRSEDEFALRLRTLDERIAQPLRRAVQRHMAHGTSSLSASPRASSKLSAELDLQRSLTNPEQRFVSDVLKLVAECESLSRLSEKLRSDLANELGLSRVPSSSKQVAAAFYMSLRLKRGENRSQCASAPEDGAARVGAVFRRFGPFFKMFGAYARRFHETVQARAFLSGLAFFEDDDLDVSGALSAPVERLRDYERLLSDLVRLTPPGHADAYDAQLAVDMVDDALRHVDQTLQGDVAFKRLIQILEPSSLTSLLDVPTRKLVKEGKLEQIKFGATGGRIEINPVRCLALSDRILLVFFPKSHNDYRFRRPNIFGTAISPSSAASAKADESSVVSSLAACERGAKGRLAYNLALQDIASVEACNDAVSLSSTARRLAATADELKIDTEGNDCLAGEDDDEESLFRIETTCRNVIVLRADTNSTRDAWLATISDLLPLAASLPRTTDEESSRRPPKLLRRDSDPQPANRHKPHLLYRTRRMLSLTIPNNIRSKT